MYRAQSDRGTRFKRAKNGPCENVCTSYVFVALVKYTQMRNQRNKQEMDEEKKMRAKNQFELHIRALLRALVCAVTECVCVYSFRADLVGIFAEIVCILSSPYQMRSQSN